MSKLEHCDTKGHNFEKSEVGILECELCSKWIPARAGTVQELQKKIDALGECSQAIAETLTTKVKEDE